MPTLTKNGERHCPKCEKPLGKKNSDWALLLCKPCIKWEAKREKHTKRMDNRLKHGTGLTNMLLKYQQAPEPKLDGPPTLTLDDLPIEGSKYISGMNYSVEKLEALCKPWGHAVYKRQLQAEKQGQPFRYTGTTTVRRDSVMDQARPTLETPRQSNPLCDDDTGSHSGEQEQGNSEKNAWYKAMVAPCLSCEKVPGRNINHPVADCPWNKQMLRRVVHFRLRQEGLESAEGTESDGDKTTNQWREANSCLGGTGHRIEKKSGEVRASFGNCAQAPCLDCDKRRLPSAHGHCLLDCENVRDDYLRQVQQKFKDAIDWANELVGNTTSRKRVAEKKYPESHLKRKQNDQEQLSQERATKRQVLAERLEQETPLFGAQIQQSIEADHDWRWDVLIDILRMEMTARPDTPLQVALAVKHELENRLIEDIKNVDAIEEGTPISIPLLEVLKAYIESL